MRHKLHPSLDASAAGFFVIVSVLAGCSLPDRSLREPAAAKYDPVNGRLREFAFDTTQNGRNDSIGFMDGTQIHRIEVDEDEDGKVDRWEFYDRNRQLARAGFSRQRNGVLDGMAFYGPAGQVERVEVSTRGDGSFNRIEFYRFESLVRVEEDTNGDGRTDKWETYTVEGPRAPGQSPSIATASFDDSFRGTPSRRVVYRPGGTGVLRIEVDPDGDGTFEKSPAPTPAQRE